MNTRRRLEHLAKILREYAAIPGIVEVGEFDLRTWAKSQRAGFPPSTEKLICGTSACACGLAAYDASFQHMGLSMGINLTGDAYVCYNDLRAFDAIQAFFGLTYKQSLWLFKADAYPQEQRTGKGGALAVAGRIERLIEHLDAQMEIPSI